MSVRTGKKTSFRGDSTMHAQRVVEFVTVVGFAVAASIGNTANAAAVTQTYTNAQYATYDLTGQVVVSLYDPEASFYPDAISDSSVTGASGSASSYAYGTYGVWKISGASAFSGSGAFNGYTEGSALARAFSTTTDSLTITGSDTGTSGTLTASILVSGATSANAANTAYSSSETYVSIAVDSGTTADSDFSLQINHRKINGTAQYFVLDNNGTYLTESPYQIWTFDIPFVFGEAFTFYVGLDGQATQTGNYVQQGSFDLANSLYWGGISGVYGATGAMLTNFAISSESGTDWTRSFIPQNNVPEPATLALFGLGLAGIGAVRRKKLAA